MLNLILKVFLLQEGKSKMPWLYWDAIYYWFKKCKLLGLFITGREM